MVSPPFFVYNPMMLRRTLPRLGDFLFVIILAGCVLLGQRMLNVDSDLGRHLTLGTYMLESGTVPAQDLLSFTKAGESRPPYEWLAQLALAASNKLFGLDGVVVLTATAIAAAFMLAYRDGRDRSGSPVLALFVTVWAAAASSLHWLTRPHVLSFVFLVVWIRLLEQMRLGRLRGVWQLPLIMLLWANVHGGFVFGFMAWGAYLLGWAWSRMRGQAAQDVGANLLLAGTGSLVASIATPDLWNNWVGIHGNASAYVLARTAETLPPHLNAPGTWPFAVLLLAVAVFAVAVRRTIAPAHAMILVGFGVAALAIARNIPIFCLAAAPILTQWARSTMQNLAPFIRLEERISHTESSLKGWFWSPLAVLMTVLILGLSAKGSGHKFYRYDPAVFPVAAVDWIGQHHPQGNMLNELNWGGYILFRLWPTHRVFIDSQSDFYREELIREYESIMTGKDGWAAALERWEVDWMIIDPASGLATLVRREPQWRVSYEDAVAIVFMRAHEQ